MSTSFCQSQFAGVVDNLSIQVSDVSDCEPRIAGDLIFALLN